MMSRIFKIGAEGIDAEGKPEKILNEVGVAVRDESRQFRNFGDILDDLNSKWSGMSKTQQLAVAQQVAGIQRYNDFISLMNNYQIATDATTKAINSQGSAEKENQIYMQSAQARLNQLKASWQSIALNTFNSDGMRTMLTVANDLTKSFANIPTAIMAIVTALALWKGTQITTWIMNSAKSIASFGETVKMVVTSQNKCQAATMALGDSFKALGAAKTAAIGLGVLSVAILGVVMAIDKIQTTSQKLQDVNEQFEKTKASISNMSDAEQLATQYADLQSKMKAGNLSTDEMTKSKKDLITVQEKLAQTFPELITG